MTRPGFDSETLMRVTGGDPTLAEELIDMLLSQLPEQHANIHRAFDEEDLKTLAVVSHTICGGAAYAGALALRCYSGELEDAANTGEKMRIGTALAKLDQEIDRLLAGCHP